MTGSMDAGALISISDEEFQLIRGLVHGQLGIHLTASKRSLVAGRLNFFLREKGFPNLTAYYEGVRNDRSGKELSELADRITTNHTFFNREKSHFDYLTQVVLPEITAEKRRRQSKVLKVWCAASSTGEEAYMLAMLIMDYLGPDYGSWDAGVLATDISEAVLQEARAGVYNEERISKLPEPLRNRHFQKLPDGNFRVAPRLAREVTFRRFNLINADYPFRSGFDVIFCRNVMIYFDGPTKEALIARMHRFTNPGGYLFVGHSESLDRRTCPYQFVRPAVYRKAPSHD